MADEVKLDAVVKALTDGYNSQDRMLWSQTGTLMALQGGVLAAGYALRGGWFVVAPALLGVFFTLIIFSFQRKVRADRDFCGNLLDTIWKQYGSAEVKAALRNAHPDGRFFRPGYYLGKGKHVAFLNGESLPTFRGHSLLGISVIMCLLLDVLVLLLRYAPAK